MGLCDHPFDRLGSAGKARQCALAGPKGRGTSSKGVRGRTIIDMFVYIAMPVGIFCGPSKARTGWHKQTQLARLVREYNFSCEPLGEHFSFQVSTFTVLLATV